MDSSNYSVYKILKRNKSHPYKVKLMQDIDKDDPDGKNHLWIAETEKFRQTLNVHES